MQTSVARNTTPTFIAEFELLEGSPGAFAAVDRVETLARSLANAALGRLRDRVRQAKRSPAWAAARAMPKGKERSAAFSAAQTAYGLSKYAVFGVVTAMKNAYKDAAQYLGAHVTQKIAARVWQAIEKLLFAKSKRVRFKKKCEAFSFEGQNNATFLRGFSGFGPVFAPYVTLDKSLLLAKFEHANPYHRHAVKHRVKYVRLVKRRIRGATRYFAQFILEGRAYRDREKEEIHLSCLQETLLGATYEAEVAAVEPCYQNRIAVDFGPSHVAISTAVVSFERDIAGEIKQKTQEIKLTQRHMDRQRRDRNPDNYNANGTVRKGRKVWKTSRANQRAQEQYADLCRRQVAHRKSLHGSLAYDILALGTDVYLEKVSYKGWQRRFGKSIAKHGPSALEGTLTRKAENARGSVTLVNTYQTGLSSTCMCGERCKKSLSERFHVCHHCGLGTTAALPRDTFSAFLALFTESEMVSRKGKKAETTLSSRLDLEAARRHALGHRTLSHVLSAPASAKEPAPASQPAVLVTTQVEVQVQTPEASADSGHELSVSRGLRAKSCSKACQESAKPKVPRCRRQVRKKATPEASGIPFL